MNSCNKAAAVLLALFFPFFGSLVAMDTARRSPAVARVTAEVSESARPVKLYRLKPQVIELAELTPHCKELHNWACVLDAARKRKGH